MYAARDRARVAGADRLRHDRVHGHQAAHAERCQPEEVEISERDSGQVAGRDPPDHDGVDHAHEHEPDLDGDDRHREPEERAGVGGGGQERAEHGPGVVSEPARPAQLLFVRRPSAVGAFMGRILLELRARWSAHFADWECSGGHYDRAERMLRAALALAERAGSDPSLRLALFNSLGVVHKYQARYADSRRAYREALMIVRAQIGREHPLPPALYHNLGGLEHARGRFARGEVLARRGLALRERALGREHLDVARDLEALAAIVDGRKRHREAEALHRRALAIFQHRLRAEHPDTAAALANLAACLHFQGRSTEAECVGLQAVAMSRRILGATHPETQAAEANLAVIQSTRVPGRGSEEVGPTLGAPLGSPAPTRL